MQGDQRQDQAEPLDSSMTLEAGERIDEGARPEKRSAGAIFESIKSNRAALVLIGAVAFGGVMFVVSKNRTAELMFMHRNTVNYRIQQIENLFSVDFSDPSLLFKLQYSFYIDAFLKNRYSDLAALPEKPAGE